MLLPAVKWENDIDLRNIKYQLYIDSRSIGYIKSIWRQEFEWR